MRPLSVIILLYFLMSCIDSISKRKLKKISKEIKKQEPIPWEIIRKEDEPSKMDIKVAAAEVTLSDDKSLFIRFPEHDKDKRPTTWEPYSWHWKQRPSSFLNRERLRGLWKPKIVLTKQGDQEPTMIWHKDKLSAALKKGYATFDGIQNILKVTQCDIPVAETTGNTDKMYGADHLCRGKHAADDKYDPKQPLAVMAHYQSISFVDFDKKQEGRADRVTNMRTYTPRQTVFAFKCNTVNAHGRVWIPDGFATYHWIPPQVRKRIEQGYCGSFVKTDETDKSPELLVHIPCHSLLYLANNMQFGTVSGEHRFSCITSASENRVFVEKNAANARYDDLVELIYDEYDADAYYDDGYLESVYDYLYKQMKSLMRYNEENK